MSVLTETQVLRALAAPPPRFRPAAPEPVERDLNLFQLMTTGAARNLLTAVPKSAYEDLYRHVRVLNFVYHGVSDPRQIQHVLVDNAANYRRSSLVQRILRPAIGEGLFTAEGDAWRSQRRLMAPAFLPHAVAAFTPLFAEAAAQGARRLADLAPAGDGVVDMAEEATRATLAVIDGALFSGESGMPFDESSALVRAFLGGSIEVTLGLMLGLAMLDAAPRQRLARRARRVLISKMAAFIHRRADEPEPKDDFVTRLYKAFLAEHPRDEAIQLTLDNAMTFFVAGHETTANGMAWALYLLSGDAQAQAQAWAREEARAAWAASDDPAEVLQLLPYLKMVWDETLRLYPPVHRIDREALGDDEVCGRRVRKGEVITIWPWIVHRHKALWSEPELFNPENFDPEAKAGRSRFQYLPFGAGPRMCIGMGFAEAEALIILSRWVAEYSFAPAPGHAVRPATDFTLRPQGGLPLTVRRL